MAVAVFCVLSALGLIAAAQASCSVTLSKNSFAASEHKEAVVLKSNEKVGSSWQVLGVPLGAVAASGDLQSSGPQLLLDFSDLDTPGSYKLQVAGCNDSPTFTVQNPLFEQRDNVDEQDSLLGAKNKYQDNGISRGAGIALIVITVLLFVVTAVLGIYTIYLYCA